MNMSQWNSENVNTQFAWDMNIIFYLAAIFSQPEIRIKDVTD